MALDNLEGDAPMLLRPVQERAAVAAIDPAVPQLGLACLLRRIGRLADPAGAPHLVPRGRTPILRHRFGWKKASMAAALGYRPDGTAARLCFHLQQPSDNPDTLIGVLEQLAGFYVGQRVVLIWDGLSAHWSTKMRAFLDSWFSRWGITGLSKSQVSVMARDLDAHVADFRTRPLDEGPYTFVAADALTMKVREGGRVRNVAVLVATGVNADGHREVLGIQVATGETNAGWLAFFRDLVARGLTGVALVTSDAHAGLVEAIAATVPGASWQRCRTHYAANLMAVCRKAAWPGVKAMLHSVYDQPDVDISRAWAPIILTPYASIGPSCAGVFGA
jgi:hypothetical protein